MPTQTIERLSKGQNQWQILNLKLPQAQFDTGCLQINNNEIILFGGFSEGPIDSVYTYKNTNPKEEGEFVEISSENSQQSSRNGLVKPDFFVVNGQYMEMPESKWENEGQRERIFMGH